MEWPRLVLVLQLATTLPLAGLIWLVQIVSYPLFAQVGAAEFPAYHAAHARLITFVVAPLMLLELASALAGVVLLDRIMPRELAWVGAALAVLVWLATMFVSVPKHDLLTRGFDMSAHEALVATNWIRTALWTIRSVLLLSAFGRV